MNLISAVLILTCLPSALIDFALPKWKSDRYFRIEDAYKWIYQATLGGEHAIPDEALASKWLAVEWQTLGQQTENERSWEPLCPGGEIGRLNLRAFRSSGGKADDLLNAFLASAREYRSDESDFVAAWIELGKRLRQRSVRNLNSRAWKTLDDKMKPIRYPAIHDSKTYENAHHPAYRVLTLKQMQMLLGTTNR